MVMYRNTFRFSALAVTVALSLFSGSAIAGGLTQKPADQTEASLLNEAEAIPDVEVVLKKKPPVQFAGGLGMVDSAKGRQKPVAAAKASPVRDEPPANNKKTDKAGSFSFENVPVGTYNLTFDAPKVSPALVGKVEYLVIVEQVEARAADNSAKQTYDDTKPKTARIPIAKIKDGLDFTVGPPPPGNVFQATKPKSKNSAGVSGSQKKEPPPAMLSKAPPVMNLRGKIFLVEIGTTRIVRDQSQLKVPDR
jgi:hypothetical protein